MQELRCSNLLVLITSLLLMGVAPRAYSAPPARPAARPIGTVQAVDSTGRRITMKTDADSEMTVVLSENARLLRVKPGVRTLNGAAPIQLTDISVGDRILVRGKMSAGGNSVTASMVIVMSKEDIAAKRAAERARWEQQGVSGIITAINPTAKEITIKQGGIAGPKKLLIKLVPEAKLRRYAPDSVRFSDARPSRFGELEVGDEVMALGGKSPDGSSYTARELVSGAFQNIPARVESVDPAAGTIRVTDLITKKHLLVRVRPDSTLRRLPPRMARFMAMWMVAGAQHGPRAAGNGRPRPTRPSRMGRGTAAGGRGGRPGMAGGRRPSLQRLLHRLPPLGVAELKPGEEIIIAGTKGADPGKITAITLLAGVEPILAAASRGGRQMRMGLWNLNVNMNMGTP